MAGSGWEHDGFTATPVQVPSGFRGRRLAPGVEVAAEAVRASFSRSEFDDFFDDRVAVLESKDAGGATVFLARAGDWMQGSAAGEVLASSPAGSIALLTTRPTFSPVALLPPDVADDFERWYRGG